MRIIPLAIAGVALTNAAALSKKQEPINSNNDFLPTTTQIKSTYTPTLVDDTHMAPKTTKVSQLTKPRFLEDIAEKAQRFKNLTKTGDYSDRGETDGEFTDSEGEDKARKLDQMSNKGVTDSEYTDGEYTDSDYEGQSRQLQEVAKTDVAKDDKTLAKPEQNKDQKRVWTSESDTDSSMSDIDDYNQPGNYSKNSTDNYGDNYGDNYRDDYRRNNGDYYRGDLRDRYRDGYRDDYRGYYNDDNYDNYYNVYNKDLNRF